MAHRRVRGHHRTLARRAGWQKVFTQKVESPAADGQLLREHMTVNSDDLEVIPILDVVLQKSIPSSVGSQIGPMRQTDKREVGQRPLFFL